MNATPTMMHTALPWIVTQPSAGTLDICHEADGIRSRIARLHYELLAAEHGGSIAANAELICRAVNYHEELLDALKRLMGAYDIALYCTPEIDLVRRKARNQAAAAIAAATYSGQST